MFVGAFDVHLEDAADDSGQVGWVTLAGMPLWRCPQTFPHFPNYDMDFKRRHVLQQFAIALAEKLGTDLAEIP